MSSTAKTLQSLRQEDAFQSSLPVIALSRQYLRLSAIDILHFKGHIEDLVKPENEVSPNHLGMD